MLSFEAMLSFAALVLLMSGTSAALQVTIGTTSCQGFAFTITAAGTEKTSLSPNAIVKFNGEILI
jgi:hypothetical protein